MLTVEMQDGSQPLATAEPRFSWQYVADVTSFKPKNVVCFVDDRAIKFNGDYAEALRHIDNFKTYWEE